MTVRDQLAIDLRLAQCEFEQAGDATEATAARTRHAIESVRHAAHASRKSRARFVIPGIAVAAAHANPARMKFFNGIKGARHLRRECDPFDYVRVFKQSRDRLRRWLLNKFFTLRAAFRL